jgi:hypothetical protein
MGLARFWETVAEWLHQTDAGALKWPAVGQATGAHVKKLVVASMAIAAVAVSAPVRAADFPPYSVAKGPIIGGFDWEGFYVGGHIGGATDNVSFTQTNVGWTDLQSFATGPLGPFNTNTGESGSLGATSVTGGLQIGYNWLLPGPFLVGLEADISGAGLSSTALTSPLAIRGRWLRGPKSSTSMVRYEPGSAGCPTTGCSTAPAVSAGITTSSRASN